MNFAKFITNASMVKTYVVATLSYGLLRKGREMKNATVEYYDREKREDTRIPVLLCDKVFMTVLCGFSSVYMWPMYLYKDLKKLELRNKKLNPQWYI